MRILFSTSSLFPYRVNWLDELGKYADVDVFYLMDNDNARNTEWCAARPKNCKYTLMKSWKIPKLGQVSFGFRNYVKKHWREYDVILLDGYGFLSQMINLRYLNKKKIPYYSCIKELNIDNNKLYFLNNKDYDNENDNSSVIYTALNNFKFLFMGDAGVEVEEDLIEKYNLQDIDVLKVGHHGSNTNSSIEFIDEINNYIFIKIIENMNYCDILIK